MMTLLTPKEIRQIQLELLQEFHCFCLTNGLKYSLCGGTLLGAVRHKGYIPWDDDIDVMMPRKDYEQLIKTYKSDRSELYHYSIQESYMVPFAKLSDIRTQVIENVVYESDYGVDIDIFPLDFFPDSLKESEKWSKQLGILKDILLIKNIKLSRKRSFARNVIVFWGRIVTCPIRMKWLVKRIDTLAQKYSGKSDGFIGNMTNGYRMKERNPMAKELIDLEFEGIPYKAIDNYDVYLKGLFNDYMTLPPLEKQVSSHTVSAWWK